MDLRAPSTVIHRRLVYASDIADGLVHVISE
jgi:hypothetical protein